MNSQVLRQKYLDFFKARGHVIVPSAPLVPENDPTTLFTGSGMQPMIQYLLGTPHPKGVRIADSQKCFRSQDIEEVGDNRHTTFFEMLGNWSLGDYFKEEQLGWYFSFLTDELGLDPKRIYVTVYRGDKAVGVPRDDEATAIWQKLFKEKGIEAKAVDNAAKDGMQGGQIFYYSDKNWWSRAGAPAVMPVGEPGGPDSEVFFDFGEDKKFHENSVWKDEPCHVNCDCGRFGEIGNSVFMQYMKTDKGFEPLPQKNIDFGGGLERMLAAANDEPDVFKIDLFKDIIHQIELWTHKKYEKENRAPMRVIADHIRAAVFLIKDGVRPGNKAQGYFLRRLIRRSTIKLHQLGGGLNPASLFVIADRGVLQTYDGVQFVNRNADKDTIEEVLQIEAEKFTRSLDKGLRFFENQATITGKVAFDLYQTYGFPLEITLELAQQKGQKVNLEEFKTEFENHKNLSRTASTGMFKGGLADTSEASVKYHTATHLLHAALRKVLGTHVQQKGSNITGERLRFDFTHPAALTEAEKQRVEQQINEWIAADLPVTRQTMQKDEAFKAGALAFFAEKYPDQVSVYTIGTDPEKDWISKELCGGPHVQRTAEIGRVEIFKEKAVAAGVRRIYVRLANVA